MIQGRRRSYCSLAENRQWMAARPHGRNGVGARPCGHEGRPPPRNEEICHDDRYAIETGGRRDGGGDHRWCGPSDCWRDGLLRDTSELVPREFGDIADLRRGVG